MEIVKAIEFDLEMLRDVYTSISNETPFMERRAFWVYGDYPNDEMITKYIAGDCMYYALMDGKVCGAFALPNQGKDEYEIKWGNDIKEDEASVIHLFGLLPEYQGKGLAKEMLKSAIGIAKKKKKKCVRLDAISTNIEAIRVYEAFGFQMKGKSKWDIGLPELTNFNLYEYEL